MAAGEKQCIAIERTQPVNDSVGPGGNLRYRFTSRATIAKEIPARPLSADLFRSFPFVDAIIPFDEIVQYRDVPAKAGQLASSPRPPQRACKYMLEH